MLLGLLHNEVIEISKKYIKEEQEKQKAINAIIKFKKNFPQGFLDTFGGHNLDTLRDAWETNIAGLMQPVNNRINEAVADMIAKSGILGLIEDVAKGLSDIIHEIKKNKGVEDLLEDLGVGVGDIAFVVNIYLTLLIEFYSEVERLLGNIPQFPDPTDPVATLPPVGGGAIPTEPGGPFTPPTTLLPPVGEDPAPFQFPVIPGDPTGGAGGFQPH